MKRWVLWYYRDEIVFGCCIGNIYWLEWRDKCCVLCLLKLNGFINLVSNLRGYYCEKGKEDVVVELLKSKNIKVELIEWVKYIYDK